MRRESGTEGREGRNENEGKEGRNRERDVRDDLLTVHEFIVGVILE